LELQQFGRVSEVLAGRHRVDLNLRGGLRVDARIPGDRIKELFAAML
jgi:hypothetical protein